MKNRLPAALREALSGLHARATTLTGINPAGLFIPYRHAAALPREVAPYPAVLAAFRARDAEIAALIGEMAAHLEIFRGFGHQPRDPHWDQTMFPPLDGAAAYTLVRKLRPKRILEIGSGNSTHFLARALRDGGIEGAITCIDPAPRRAIDGLDVTFIRRLLRDDDAARVADFAADDVLFIDSSHLMLPGSDVDIQFNRLFPALPPGAVVHVHDVFLPYDYPATWRPRFYSEQNALIGWILSGFFQVIFPAHYALREHAGTLADRLGRHFPPLGLPQAGSLWLRRAG